MRFIHVQHVVPINHDRELQQRREKPQVCVANHGPAENAIGADGLEVRKKIAERIPSKRFVGSAAGTREIAKLVVSPISVHPSKITPDISFRPRKCAAKNPAAITAVMLPRNVPSSMIPFPHDSLPPAQLRQQTILRRAEKRRLRADQEILPRIQSEDSASRVPQSPPPSLQFPSASCRSHAALAVTVGEIASGHREENKWQRKQRADHQHQEIALALRKIHRHDDVNDEKFNRVVVKCVLKLRDDQRPKPALPIRRGRRRRIAERGETAGSGVAFATASVMVGSCFLTPAAPPAREAGGRMIAERERAIVTRRLDSSRKLNLRRV